MNQSKEATASRLAEGIASVDPAVEAIVRLLAPPGLETDPKEPVKLLVCNRDTTAYGIHPLYFGSDPETGVFYPYVIIDVTPGEFESILSGRLGLPHGWLVGEPLLKPLAIEQR